MVCNSPIKQDSHLGWLVALFALICLSMGVPVSKAQENVGSGAGFAIETELLLDILLDGQSLDTTILAYQRDGQIFVALGELMTVIQFPVNTDAASGQAGGWYIKEERDFLLDLGQNLVISDGVRYQPGEDVVVSESQIFVALKALEMWFPLKFQSLIRQLALNVEPTEQIPLQQMFARRNNRVFGIGAVSRDPVLPFQETPYQAVGPHATDVRLNTSSSLEGEDDKSTSLSGSYSILSRGDLAWMTSTIALSGNDRDDVSNGRIKLERQLEQPFLNLDYIEIGDVDTGSRGVLIRGGGAEAGIQGTFSDDFIDLRGDIPPDWEVELYRNGILIDVQLVGQAAQYEFLEVPLEFGENRFEFVFYGPYGEERRDERIVYAGDGLDLGDVSYSISGVEDGESVIDGFQASQRGTQGTGRYLANFNVGLGRNVTARLGVDSFEQDGDRLQDYRFGLSANFANVQTSLGFNSNAKALDSASGLIKGRLGTDTRVSVRYTEFLINGLEAEFVPDDRSLWSLDTNFASRVFNVPVAVNASRREKEQSNNTFASLGTTLPTAWARISKSFFYVRAEDESRVDEQFGGSFNFGVDHRPWRFRAGSSYELSPEAEFKDVFSSASIQLDQRMRMNFDVRHNPANNYTNYRMGFSWGLDYLQISPQISYDSNERWIGLVSLSTSFNPRPGQYNPIIDRLSQTSSGAAYARVFMDDNGDGIWSEREEGLHDVRVEAIQSYRTAVTAGDGSAYLTRLRRNQVTDVAIDPESFPDLDLVATNPGVSIKPRPGSWSTIDFPVIRTMELEGYVFQERPSGQKPGPLPRVLVKLLDQDGSLVSQQRTVFDGFYLFSNVAPGSYRIVLNEDLDSRLLERPREVKVNAGGGVLQDLNFLVAPKRETLIVESAAERQMNAPSGPRVIAPELPEEDIVFSEALMPIESEEFLPAVNTPSPEAVSEDLGPDIITEPAEDPIVNDQQETGSWHVQFGAFGVDSNARLRWDQIQSSGLLLDNQAPRFEDAGNLTRLLTDIGTTEDRARTLCAQVKSANLGDCLARQIVE